MSGPEASAAALGDLLAAAGVDTTGLDLAWLAGLKAETEAMIEAGRAETGFRDALPAWNSPTALPTREDGDAPA